jgi:hypothetical protein
LLFRQIPRRTPAAAARSLDLGRPPPPRRRFFEASIAWEKRQNALREREQRARWAWAPFAPAAGSAMQNGARKAAAGDAGSGDESDDGPAPPPRRRVSAANIAAAARRWREFQRSKRQKKALLLSE